MAFLLGALYCEVKKTFLGFLQSLVQFTFVSSAFCFHSTIPHFWGLFSFVFRKFCVGLTRSCCFVPSWTDWNTTRDYTWVICSDSLTISHIQASILGIYSGPARHYGAPEKRPDRKQTPLFTSAVNFLFLVQWYSNKKLFGIWFEMSLAGSFVFRKFCVGLTSCCLVPSWTDWNTTRGLYLL